MPHTPHQITPWIKRASTDAGLTDKMTDTFDTSVLTNIRHNPDVFNPDGSIIPGMERVARACFYEARAERLHRMQTWTSLQLAQTISGLLENDTWMHIPESTSYHSDPDRERGFWRWWMDRFGYSESKLYQTRRLFGSNGVLWHILPFLNPESPEFNISRLEDMAPAIEHAVGMTRRQAYPDWVEQMEEAQREQVVEELGEDATEEATREGVLRRYAEAIQDAPTAREMLEGLRANARDPIEVFTIRYQQIEDSVIWHVPPMSASQHARLAKRLGDAVLFVKGEFPLETA